MKSLVAVITLIILVLAGVLIYKQSVPPQAEILEQVVPIETEEVTSTTDAVATTTATTTEEN